MVEARLIAGHLPVRLRARPHLSLLILMRWWIMPSPRDRIIIHCPKCAEPWSIERYVCAARGSTRNDLAILVESWNDEAAMNEGSRKPDDQMFAIGLRKCAAELHAGLMDA